MPAVPLPAVLVRIAALCVAAAAVSAAGPGHARTPAPVASASPEARGSVTDVAPDPVPDAAQVLSSEGATLLVRGASYSTPVRSDVPIRTGDRIRTGADGRVQLRFADGALISIQPESDFRVQLYAYDATRQRSFLELARGSLRAVSGAIGKRDRNDWRLRTPTATIGIRGTEFTVREVDCTVTDCAPGVANGLTVAVIAGRVAVSNRAGTVDVPAGATLRLPDARTVPSLALAPRAARSPPRAAAMPEPGLSIASGTVGRSLRTGSTASSGPPPSADDPYAHSSWRTIDPSEREPTIPGR